MDCIVIGGVACAAHGSIRTTQDLDLLCRNNAANLVHIAAALSRLQARLKGSRQPPQPSWSAISTLTAHSRSRAHLAGMSRAA